MNIKKSIFIAFFITVSSLSGQVVKEKCLTNYIKNEKLKYNPSLANEYAKIETFTKEWISDNKNKLGKTNEVVEIPVVVHIIWRLEEENITDEQVVSQINVLNKDFRKLNSNFNNTPAEFQSVAADVEIEFRLAMQDPEGNSTNGITRTETTIDNIAAGSDYYQTVNGGKDPWDQDSYINIWVCDIGEDGTLGFATFPGSDDPADGVVIPSQFFGTVGTAVNSAPNHLGRTATHEVGHYFNLEHIWGPEESGCSDDDNVDDTPKQDWDSEGCNSFPLFDGCTTDGNGIMFMNYMDYSDDECMTMFTNGQKLRMLAALNGPRKGLLSSKGLDAVTSVEKTNITSNLFAFYPNPANNILNISSKTNKEYSVKIYDILGQEVATNLNSKSNLSMDISKLKSGIYFIELNVGSEIQFKKLLITK